MGQPSWVRRRKESVSGRHLPIGGSTWTSGTLRGAWLAAAAGASLALYVAVLAIAPRLAPAQPSFADELFPGVLWLSQEMPLESINILELRFLVLLVALFGIYGVTIWATAGRQSRRVESAVFIGGAAFLMVQLAAPAMLSSDVFSYAIYGRIYSHYDSNPHLELPIQFPGDPFLPLVYWKETPSYYGPLWTVVAGAVTGVAGDDIAVTVFLFRSVVIATALMAAGFLWHCLHRFSPDRTAQGLAFFLWNPLLILETGLSAHNDAAMVMFLLLGIWLHLRRHYAFAVTALTISALVKFATGAIIPLYLLLVLRELSGWQPRVRFLLSGAAGSTLALAVILIAARTGPESLTLNGLGAGVDRYTNSVHELIFAAARFRFTGAPPENADLKPFRVHPVFSDKTIRLPGELKLPNYYKGKDGPMPGPIGDQVNGWLRTITGLAFAGLWVAAAWHVRSFRGFVVASLATLLAVYWLLSAWIWPWYVIWALPLAALVPASWAARTAAVLSATILTLHISSGFEGGEEWWFYTYRSLPAFVLPIVIVAFAFSASRLFSTLRRAPGRIQHALLRRGERFGSSYQNNGNAHDRAAA